MALSKAKKKTVNMTFCFLIHYILYCIVKFPIVKLGIPCILPSDTQFLLILPFLAPHGIYHNMKKSKNITRTIFASGTL
jgi:hypothetical protein